jgi:hypothetical protein
MKGSANASKGINDCEKKERERAAKFGNLVKIADPVIVRVEVCFFPWKGVKQQGVVYNSCHHEYLALLE